MRTHVNKLPFQDPPDLFGMHKNAEIAYLQSESAQIIDSIISIQPKIASHNQELVPTVFNFVFPTFITAYL